MPKTKKNILLLASILIILACVPAFPTTSAPIPTFDPNAPLTAIVQTSNAAATQTQQFAPPTLTPTVTATQTSLPTDTVTPTFIFLLPTSTLPPTQIPAGSSGKDLECQVLSQEPPNNALISAQSTFTTKWLVANIGLKTWPSDNSDYRYFSGTKLHLQPIYDFEKSVKAGERIELTVAMQAPSQLGQYTTSWRITIGQESFCSLNIIIIVI